MLKDAALGVRTLDTRSRNHLFYLITLTLVLFFTGLGDRDLWAPVEPRYAEIARIMFIKGEWIVPMVNGELYTDKPILYFWLVLIASKLAGGVNEWTLRLPAAMAGIGFVVATYFTGRDFFSRRVGFVAATVLATTMRVIWEARWAHIDMVFGFFFVLTIYFGFRSLLGKGGKHEILLGYVFMGLTVLAKGLIGIVLPALLLLAFVFVRRDWRIIVAAKLPLGIPIFLLVVAPWFYLVNNSTDGKWLADFIYVHHIQRYVDGDGHRQPFYYYLTTLPVDFLPWTVFAISAVFAYFPYRQLKQQPIPQLVTLWFAVVFLFFSISDTKRDLYLLPLLPSVALFVGNYIDDLAEGRLGESTLYQWMGQLFFGALTAIGFVLPIGAWIVRRETFWISLPAAVVLAVGGIVTMILIRKHRPLKVVTAVTLLITLATVCSSIGILPYVDQFKSRRLFSLEVKRIVPATAPLYVYADTMHDFNFYTAREIIPVLSSRGEVVEAIRQPGNRYILIRAPDLKTLNMSRLEQVLVTQSVGRTTWNLVAFINNAEAEN
jgi:4-amino-4-deoxy-L-arabinose transferase-like glycosyltransferase